MGKTPGPPVATGGHRWDTGGTPNPPDCIRTICKFRTTGGTGGTGGKFRTTGGHRWPPVPPVAPAPPVVNSAPPVPPVATGATGGQFRKS